MKKNLLKATVIVMLGLVVSYTAYNSQKGNDDLSNVMLDNLEALAWGGESSGSYYLNPCPSRPGAECSSRKYDEKNRCSYLTYC